MGLSKEGVIPSELLAGFKDNVVNLWSVHIICANV